MPRIQPGRFLVGGGTPKVLAITIPSIQPKLKPDSLSSKLEALISHAGSVQNLAVLLSLPVCQLLRARKNVRLHSAMPAIIHFAHQIILGSDEQAPLIDLDWLVLGRLEDVRREWRARMEKHREGCDGDGI